MYQVFSICIHMKWTQAHATVRKRRYFSCIFPTLLLPSPLSLLPMFLPAEAAAAAIATTTTLSITNKSENSLMQGTLYDWIILPNSIAFGRFVSFDLWNMPSHTCDGRVSVCLWYCYVCMCVCVCACKFVHKNICCTKNILLHRLAYRQYERISVHL